MDIRIEKIDADLAKSFSGFILPIVLADEDFSLFSFYGAIYDEKLCGILVCDIKEFEPEILSIGVSTDYQGKGIAKALLDYAIRDIVDAFEPGVLAEIPNYITARVVEKAGMIGKMEHILTDAGFSAVLEGGFYEVDISSLKNNEYVQNPRAIDKINAPGSKMSYLPLKDVPRSMVNAFSNSLIENDIFPGIDAYSLDEDLTIFGIKDNAIQLCILFLKENGGVVQNNFLYQVNDEDISRSSLLFLMSASATEALKKFPDDIKLSFWISDEVTRKLIDRIFPEAVLMEEAKTYEYSFSDVIEANDKRFTDDIEFNPISNDTLICRDCKYCMEGMIIECEKYYQKPDTVFDDGKCAMFEAK